jgi:pyruvate dehydrogenase E2 component (dihydrolipoamide acetyltransferase)
MTKVLKFGGSSLANPNLLREVGRIVLEDLRAYLVRLQRLAARPSTLVQPAPPSASEPAPAPIDFSKWGPVSKKPLSPLRQVIARRLSESWNVVPRVTQFDEADITRLMVWRGLRASVLCRSREMPTLESTVCSVSWETEACWLATRPSLP